MAITFSHIPAASTFIPPSTLIKEEFLICSADLYSIDEELNGLLQSSDPAINSVDYAAKKIEVIVDVFNKNIKYVNTRAQQFKPYEEPSFRGYCCEYLSLPQQEMQRNETALKEKYTDAIGKAKCAFLERAEEMSQLDQLGAIGDRFLKRNIESVIDKLKKIKSSAYATKDYSLEKYSSPGFPLLFNPGMKDLPHEKTLDSDAVSPLPSNIDVDVICNVGEGNTLGICHNPSWGDKPVAFTKNEKGWSGQVPAGKDWKFVVIQNGQVIKWEEGANRRCEAKADAFTVNELRFH